MSKPGLTFTAFDKSPSPSNTARVRSAQMRRLARQFSASVNDDKFGRQQLRLLSKPLYSYGKAGSQVLDGAIFAFAKGTNPEVLVLIEAVPKANGDYMWRYAPARMSGRECELKQKDQVVWTIPAAPSKYSTREDTYFNEIFR